MYRHIPAKKHVFEDTDSSFPVIPSSPTLWSFKSLNLETSRWKLRWPENPVCRSTWKSVDFADVPLATHPRDRLLSPNPRPTSISPIDKAFLSSASLPSRTAGFLPIKLIPFVEKCLSSQGAPDRALHNSTDAIAIPAQSSWMEDNNKDCCPDELGIVWSFIGPYAASLSPGAFIDALPDISQGLCGSKSYPRGRTCWRWWKETEHQPEAAYILGRERFSSLFSGLGRCQRGTCYIGYISLPQESCFPPPAYAYIISLARLFRSRQYDSGCIMYSCEIAISPTYQQLLRYISGGIRVFVISSPVHGTPPSESQSFFEAVNEQPKCLYRSGTAECRLFVSCPLA